MTCAASLTAPDPRRVPGRTSSSSCPNWPAWPTPASPKSRNDGPPRTGFYPKKDRNDVLRPGAYQHLAEEFERRREALLAVGAVVDPRTAQIERVKGEVAVLRGRMASRDEQITELTVFKTAAISRLAAQHYEIERLRRLLNDRPSHRVLSLSTLNGDIVNPTTRKDP